MRNKLVRLRLQYPRVIASLNGMLIERGVGMKNGLRHFGLACGVVGLLAATTAASTPTYSLNMAGIKKAGQDPVVFRDITCDPNNDACEILAGPGSKCAETEVVVSDFWHDRCSPLDQVVSLRCVDGPTPGVSCSIDNDCNTNEGGTCRRLAVPASHCVGGLTEGALCAINVDCGVDGTCVQGSIVPLLCGGGPTPGEPCMEDADCGAGGLCDRSFVEPGDQVIVEAFLHGWDDDPDRGVCDVSPAFPSCDIGGAPCTGKHCQNDHTACQTPADCVGGQQCVPNECVVNPLCGNHQWTIQSDRFVTLGDDPNPNAALLPAKVECTTDADCRHGRVAGGGQCTCGRATCNLATGTCSGTATAYIDMVRADYVYRRLHSSQYQAAVQLDWDNIAYIGATLSALNDVQQEEYVGTLWLQAPPQAAGTYKLGLNPDENLTYLLDERVIRFPGVYVVDLQIEVFNPCEDFDIPVECGPDPDACRYWTCIALNGVPNCSLVNTDCVADPDYGSGFCCVAEEDGCVECRACCPPNDGPCRVDSELECDTSGGEWLDHLTCFDDDGLDVCEEPPVCPGPLDWDECVPPTGVLDARQPRDVTGGEKQGIDLIVVTGIPGAHDACFEFCESEREGLSNDIIGVDEDPEGTYAIQLRRRITPGARTTITYDALGNFTSVGTFDSLPADVDASETSDVDDIVEMVECCLNQVCAPVHGEYSCDLDRSGGVSGADVLRVIDLLHGAGDLTKAWDGEELRWPGCP